MVFSVDHTYLPSVRTNVLDGIVLVGHVQHLFGVLGAHFSLTNFPFEVKRWRTIGW